MHQQAQGVHREFEALAPDEALAPATSRWAAIGWVAGSRQGWGWGNIPRGQAE
jgi:hypothetical protein